MILDKKIHFWAFVIASMFCLDHFVIYWNFPDIIGLLSSAMLIYSVELMVRHAESIGKSI